MLARFLRADVLSLTSSCGKCNCKENAMNLSGLSEGSNSVRESFQRSRVNGGISKSDLTELTSKLEGSPEAEKIGSLLSSFDTIDVDSSGRIDQTEVETYTGQMRIRGGKGGQPPGPPPEMTLEGINNRLSELSENGEEDPLLEKLASSFEESDTNQDGKISAGEFAGFAESNGFELPDRKGGSMPPPPDQNDVTSSTGNSAMSKEEIESFDITKFILDSIFQSYENASAASTESKSTSILSASITA